MIRPELVRKQNLFAFDSVLYNFHSTTVYLSDDKSQLSSQSLAYARVIVQYFFRFFLLGVILEKKIESQLMRDWFNSHLVRKNRFALDSEIIQYTKRKSIFAFGAELVRFTKKKLDSHLIRKINSHLILNSFDLEKETRIIFDWKWFDSFFF